MGNTKPIIVYTKVMCAVCGQQKYYGKNTPEAKELEPCVKCGSRLIVKKNVQRISRQTHTVDDRSHGPI